MTQAQDYEILDFNFKPTPNSVSLWEQVRVTGGPMFKDEDSVAFRNLDSCMEHHPVHSSENRTLFCGGLIFNLLLGDALADGDYDYYRDRPLLDRFYFSSMLFQYEVQKRVDIPENTLVCLSTDGWPNVFRLPEGHLFLRDPIKCLTIKLYDPTTMPPPFNLNPLT